MSALCFESSSDERAGWRYEHGLWLCPVEGHVVSLPCPAGRPDATGGPYCDEHGGAARARADAERDWNWLAPECVGNHEAVLIAGTAALDSRHAYVVVSRREGHGWFAWRGLGSHLEAVERPGYTGCGRANCRSCREGKGCGRRRCVFAIRESAIAAATSEWRIRLLERIEEISRLRGDTLSWGVAITPLADPIVLDVPEGGNAWDVAVTRERIGSVGIAMMSGVRGTGECA